MFFFSGEQTVSLDDKGRLRIPNKIREKLDGGYVIYAGTKDCLFLVTQQDFQEKYSMISHNAQLKNTVQQEALRKLSSTIQIPEEDSQGRFILQPKLKALANIKKKVVFLGVMNRIEIWSEELYNARFSIEQIDMDEVIKALDI